MRVCVHECVRVCVLVMFIAMLFLIVLKREVRETVMQFLYFLKMITFSVLVICQVKFSLLTGSQLCGSAAFLHFLIIENSRFLDFKSFVQMSKFKKYQLNQKM